MLNSENPLPFKLDPRLENNSFELFDFPLSQCRLINNQNFLWVLLIPKKNNTQELIQLSFENQIQLLKEINQVSQVLLEFSSCEKLNIATLGNIVPQLHIHLIARNSQDIAWPNPVWGTPAKPYSPEDAQNLIKKLQIKFSNQII